DGAAHPQPRRLARPPARARRPAGRADRRRRAGPAARRGRRLPGARPRGPERSDRRHRGAAAPAHAERRGAALLLDDGDVRHRGRHHGGRALDRVVLPRRRDDGAGDARALAHVSLVARFHQVGAGQQRVEACRRAAHVDGPARQVAARGRAGTAPSVVSSARSPRALTTCPVRARTTALWPSLACRPWTWSETALERATAPAIAAAQTAKATSGRTIRFEPATSGAA